MSGPGGRRSSRICRGVTRTRPETAGEAGDGVWAIYVVSADGGARVEEVYASELDALRANRNNTDPTRKVRFLPYGIAVSVLDDSDETVIGRRRVDSDGSRRRLRHVRVLYDTMVTMPHATLAMSLSQRW